VGAAKVCAVAVGGTATLDPTKPIEHPDRFVASNLVVTPEQLVLADPVKHPTWDHNADDEHAA
jgi:hypothetical protein